MDISRPVTKQQTWTLFKWTGHDFRVDVLSRKMDYDDLFGVIGQVIAVGKAQGRRNYAVTRAEAERLLANFPAN